MKISGQQYSMLYGPTVGDKVRLADTDLIIEVEKDYTCLLYTSGESSFRFGPFIEVFQCMTQFIFYNADFRHVAFK